LKRDLTSWRHSGEGRNLAATAERHGDIPAFAGMTIEMKMSRLRW